MNSLQILNAKSVEMIATTEGAVLLLEPLQGYLAHKKQPPPLRAAIGP